MYKIVTAGTLASFREAVQERFDDGWDWVDGGGNVAVVPGREGKMSKVIGGFWAVMEVERCCDIECDCVTTTDKTQGAVSVSDLVMLEAIGELFKERGDVV